MTIKEKKLDDKKKHKVKHKVVVSVKSSLTIRN